MKLRNPGRVGLLGLLLLPLLGSTCTKEKAVDFVVVGESVATFQARGADDFGSDEFDLKGDLDLERIAQDYLVELQRIEKVTFRGLWYRITREDPEPERVIENGQLEIQFRQFEGQVGSPYSLVPLATSFGTVPDDPGAPRGAGAVTDWIDVTSLVDPLGVREINDFLDRCLTAAKNGTVADGTWVFYHWTGDSRPTGNTNFDWQAKVVLNVIAAVDVEVPDF